MLFEEIPGYLGFIVSECGQVQNTKTEELLKATVGDRGYLRVKMKNEAGAWVSERLHRAVVLAHRGFPPSPDHTQVRHLDSVKTNVHLSNLVWGTSRENYDDVIRHGTQCGRRYTLTEDQRAAVMASDEPTSVLAQRYGVAAITIDRTRSGYSRRRLGA